MRNMLQIVGCFISFMLKKRDIMNQFCEMSLFDQLTKLGNRHAMDEYIASIQKDRSLGVVYCDITGLKMANDTLGHKMGDELLNLCVDIKEDALQDRVALLRENTAQNSVNLAVGVVCGTRLFFGPQYEHLRYIRFIQLGQIFAAYSGSHHAPQFHQSKIPRMRSRRPLGCVLPYS